MLSRLARQNRYQIEVTILKNHYDGISLKDQKTHQFLYYIIFFWQPYTLRLQVDQLRLNAARVLLGSFTLFLSFVVGVSWFKEIGLKTRVTEPMSILT